MNICKILLLSIVLVVTGCASSEPKEAPVPIEGVMPINYETCSYYFHAIDNEVKIGFHPRSKYGIYFYQELSERLYQAAVLKGQVDNISLDVVKNSNIDKDGWKTLYYHDECNKIIFPVMKHSKMIKEEYLNLKLKKELYD